MAYRLIIPVLLALMLTSCSFYESDALNPAALFASKPADTVIDTANLPTPALQQHLFNPADGLDMTEIAQLAIINNPNLKLARDDGHIAAAQSFSAGLLPDPQLGLAFDHPTNNDPGLTNAYGITLGYDFASLLKLPVARAAASADNKKTDLNFLWQELQIISQAKLLFVKSVSQTQALAALRDYHAFLSERHQRILKAVSEHRIANDAASAVLSAYDDITTKLAEAEKQAEKNRHDLNALLGLQPDTVLTLTDSTAPDVESADIQEALANLTKRRPDLIALEQGYNSQNDKYIEALIGQFPAVNVGFTRTRDTSDIRTNGFALTLSLPIFNRNQGAVAVEKATREKLHDEYQIRVNKAHEEIAALIDEHTLTQKQYADASESLAQWQHTIALSDKALEARHIDLFTYTNLRNAGLTKQLDVIALKQALEEQAIGLTTLTGQELQSKEAKP